MLVFDRKAFKSGVQVIRIPETQEDGSVKEIVHFLRVADKGKSFDFGANEAYVLKKYAALFKEV